MSRTSERREGKGMAPTLDLVRRYPASSVWMGCTFAVSIGALVIDVLSSH